MEDFQKCYHFSIKLLSKKDYSIFKLKQKLVGQNFTEDEICETINRLQELNYLREEEFTQTRIKSLITRYYSNQYIQEKLLSEGLTSHDEMINSIRNEYDLNTDKVIQYLIQKKIGTKIISSDSEENYKIKNKVMSFLSSKGYGYDEIEYVLEEFIA